MNWRQIFHHFVTAVVLAILAVCVVCVAAVAFVLDDGFALLGRIIRSREERPLVATKFSKRKMSA